MNTIELIIEPRTAQIGDEFEVKRILPFRARRMVGPFIFLDEMGPMTVSTDGSADVLPHPHIGLSTVTYLFEGELIHRDSLGTYQSILPGEVNWMTAGRGIVHSERFRKTESGHSRVYGIQAWVALPQALEETEPSFAHYAKSELPVFEKNGVRIQLIAGSAWEFSSPVKTHSPLFYLSTEFSPEQQLVFDACGQEAAFYLAQGEVRIDGETIAAPKLVVLKTGASIEISATKKSLGMLLGGEALDGPRFISWNFVSSSKERLDQARDDWKAQRFPKIPGETGFVPFPEK